SGTYAFHAERLGGDVPILEAPGVSAGLPFVIHNIGTADDDYIVSLVDGPASWHPTLSTTAAAFVPAGHDLLAYVGVRFPEHGSSPDPQLFRIAIQSAGDPLGVQFLDLVAVPEPAGNLRIGVVGGHDLLLPDRGKANDVVVAARQPGGTNHTSITFTADST